jgi:2-(1,2-epoxy-1,2-dihydrophenyl)acetyl-CoA isomerase
MSDELVLLEKKDQIGWITLNRPEALNAMDENMKAAITDALAKAEFDDDIRVVVIRGAGKHFQAGGDLVSFHRDRQEMSEPQYKQRFLSAINRTKLLLTAIRRMNKPVIAAVHGQAVGFGLSLAIMCDFTIATESAKFTLAYVRIGNSPDGAASYFLPRIVGLKKAIEIAMLGSQLTAQEAKDYGLINFLVSDENFVSETEELANRLASGPTQAYGSIKKLMHMSMESSWEEQLQNEAESFVGNVMTDDFGEGLASFMEKRKSQFTGK